ncbi:carboxypeptidase regulatory-like domain-containing protein [bacterium]|nr:carboxypeptidase regulatory-like domain-containing protein [bacterium]
MNILNRTVSRILVMSCVLLTLFAVIGCGGGTQGTGGIAIEGRILKTDGTALANTKVTVAQTGDSTTTDANGDFSLTAKVTGTTSLLVESDTVSTEVAIGDISAQASTVRVTISVDENENSGTVEEIEIEERDDNSNSNENAGSNSGIEDDDTSQEFSTEEDDTSLDEDENDDSSQEESNSGSSNSNNSDSDSQESSNSGSSNSGSSNSGSSNSGSGNGGSGNSEVETCEDQDIIGTISDLNTDSITVSGITFLINTETRVEDINENPISLQSLTTGMSVRVKGDCINDILVAERIRLV